MASESPGLLDYQEPKFGQTLLFLTVFNNDKKSCETLLKLGASPNIHDTYDGSTPLIESAGVNNGVGDNTFFLKLMLSYGGEPNAVESGERRVGNRTRYTPLIRACSHVKKMFSPIEKVKLLVEACADVNYQSEFGESALESSLIMNHYDVAYYLLVHGADYNQIIIDRSKFSKHGKKLKIEHVLREEMLRLNSESYQDKLKIINFLASKGIDYYAVPIPKSVKKKAKEKYGKGYKDYLKVY